MTTDEKEEHLKRMQAHRLRVAQEKQLLSLKLGRYGKAFGGLVLALRLFEAKCEHAFRAGCRYCAAREALGEAQKVMQEEDVP